jgi:transcriptional regulator with XRE-family HTH domain
MTDLGGELHRLLTERGISLTAAAREAGCSKGYLSNAASGRKPLTPRVAAGLDRLFGTDGTFAAYALAPQPRSSGPASADTGTQAVRITPASTRETGDGAKHESPASEGQEEERLGYALAHPAGTDLLAVAHLREQVCRLDEQYDRSPAAALIAGAGQCLGQIGFLRTHARRADVRRDLSAAEAEAATLMGQLVWDASQRREQATALAYYDRAVTAARRRGDRAAEGLALLRTSMVALYGHKDPRAGLAACQHAAGVAAGASAVLTGLAMLHAAEAHAMLGDGPAASRPWSAAADARR